MNAGKQEKRNQTELTEFCRIRGATRISDEINHFARKDEKLTISNRELSSGYRLSFRCDQLASSRSNGCDPLSVCPTGMSLWLRLAVMSFNRSAPVTADHRLGVQAGTLLQ